MKRSRFFMAIAGLFLVPKAEFFCRPERLVITTTGNVGIGIPPFPSAILHVQSGKVGVSRWMTEEDH